MKLHRIASHVGLLILCLASSASFAAPLATPGSQVVSPSASDAQSGCPELLNHTFPKLQNETPQSLCQYKSKVILVVNTASYCGFTYQYKGLEDLYQKYKDRGLVVLGFPSNDFFQEKSKNEDIADFCFNTYGVVFPMFAKSSVHGASANSLYKQLIKKTGKEPSWNFNKYLIDRSAQSVTHYSSSVEPNDKEFLGQLEKLLSRP